MMSTAATASEIDEFLNGALITWVCNVCNTLTIGIHFFFFSFLLVLNINTSSWLGQAKPIKCRPLPSFLHFFFTYNNNIFIHFNNVYESNILG